MSRKTNIVHITFHCPLTGVTRSAISANHRKKNRAALRQDRPKTCSSSCKAKISAAPYHRPAAAKLSL